MIRPRPQSSGSYREYRTNEYEDEDDDELAEDSGGGLKGYKLDNPNSRGPSLRQGKPLVIWIIGKPH